MSLPLTACAGSVLSDVIYSSQDGETGPVIPTSVGRVSILRQVS